MAKLLNHDQNLIATFLSARRAGYLPRSRLIGETSPADYEGSSAMNFVCKGGTLNTSFLDFDGNPKGLLKDKPLYCEFVN